MEINTRKEQSTGLKVGLGEFKVLAVNPTRTELNTILGKESSGEDKEIEYMGEGQDSGNTTIRLTFWLQELTSNFKTPLTFFVENADQIAQTGKIQFVNAVGASSYCDSEDNLQDWFKKAMTFRVAKKGEADVMEFLRSWMTGIELNVEKGGNRNNILLDMEKLFKGNVKEISDLVNSEFAGTACCLATVKSKETTEGMKDYQNIYNRKFLPGNCIRYFEAKIKKPFPKFVQKFVDELRGDHGPKDYFSMDPLRDYKPGENPVTSNQPILQPKAPTY